MTMIRNVSVKPIENPYCFSLLQPLVELAIQRLHSWEFSILPNWGSLFSLQMLACTFATETINSESVE